ncbi:hypothetical protein INT43_008021 [Umbelopsis isabellina]|uniref:Uncharacterized protein n=1 Tax=Mortierella isabellina TaxID=91625 RepID=A0A8H7PPU5_MORIS|nr:hypothetical protein INT43_008021 [Umbelopsis isabellina]
MEALPLDDSDLDTGILDDPPFVCYLDLRLQGNRLQDQQRPQTAKMQTQKKFSNDATFSAHLKSAKHIQNEKAAKKAPAPPANQKNSAKSDGAINSGIGQANLKLKQARNIVSSRPSRAATAMWNLAQDFYKLKRPRDTAEIMKDLINLLEEMQSSGSQNAEESPLTPLQISGTLYLTRLALSRLYLIYGNQTLISNARQLYLRAIHHKWKIEEQSVLDVSRVCMKCMDLPLSNLLESAQHILKIYIDKVLSKPAKTKADPNQVLPTILAEGRNLFSNFDMQTNLTDAEEESYLSSPYQVALVLCAMELSIQSISGNKDEEVDLYHLLSKLYLNIDAKYLAAETLLQCSIISSKHYMDDGLAKHTRDALDAFVICIEIDDIVRAEEIIDTLQWSDEFDDIKVLMELAKAIVDSNKLFIEQVLYYQIEHVHLLLRKDESDNKLLLRSLDATERTRIWNRVIEVARRNFLDV